MDPIKEAFLKVKEDMDLLNKEVSDLKEDFSEVRQRIIDLSDIIRDLTFKINEKQDKLPLREVPTDRQNSSTDTQINQTDRQFFKPLNTQNKVVSIGNQGVPTDRQTNQQTDRHIDKSSYNQEKQLIKTESIKEINSIDNALDLLNSLDNIKKEIRLKFKKLTDQEMLVFSSLYQLEEEKGFSDYKSLSIKLNLSESSIRDYVGKLIQKGIPIEKVKVNNKNIQLKISENLRKIASLPTILQLRDL